MSVLETLERETGPGREHEGYRYRKHPNWRRLFFRSLMKHGSVPKASHEVGVHPKSVHRLKRTDPRFKRRFDQAMLHANMVLKDDLETAIRTRATVGHTRNVLDKDGNLVEIHDKPSDKAAELLLKAKFPRQYDRARGSSLTINNNQQITAEVRIAMLLDPEKRKAACDLAAIVAAPRAISGPPSGQPPCMLPSGPTDEAGE